MLIKVKLLLLATGKSSGPHLHFHVMQPLNECGIPTLVKIIFGILVIQFLLHLKIHLSTVMVYLKKI